MVTTRVCAEYDEEGMPERRRRLVEARDRTHYVDAAAAIPSLALPPASSQTAWLRHSAGDPDMACAC